MTLINDLQNDPKNARKRTDRSAKLIKQSLEQYGAARSIVIDENNRILAGNGTIAGAKAAGIKNLKIIESNGDEIIAVKRTGLSEEEKVGLAIADNRTGDLSEWDIDMLEQLSKEHDLNDFFDKKELDDILSKKEVIPTEGLTDPDDVPEVPEEPITKEGDLYILGNHRLLCGDSTNIQHVEKLMDGKKAHLLHADPPYGMGKESDGVANDNLYNEKLDNFQMEWWATFRPFLFDNASAYIWGNAPELWSLWYKSGLGNSEKLTLRNEIVWTKKYAQGMSSEKFRMFPTATERALFFMLGEQGFSNNADNYWDGWDYIVNYLKEEKEKSGLSIKNFKKIAGHSINSGCHWFDKSQWSIPTKETYEAWQNYCYQNRIDAFKKDYEQLKKDYEQLKKEFYSTRPYFDNSYENMIDVWEFERVTGNERQNHATPKPVQMMERIMKSSLPKNGLCIEPFGGSGSTLISAERTNRMCYTMELSAFYCDVIVKRWEDFTGNTAKRVSSS